MRLRFLHLYNLPPLQDVAIVFNTGSPLARDYVIRLIVGINGTGKTHVLQALADTFLHLELGKWAPFPVTLAWDLHRSNPPRTLLLHYPGYGVEGEYFDEFVEIMPEDFSTFFISKIKRTMSLW
jgi:hypothetical protein